MNYIHTNDPPRGEICFWSPSIMKGYFRNPEKTAEAIKNDWLHTGDVGEIQASMAIKVIDRAKNIFKLSQGEYIAPEKLEGVYVQSTYVAQVWIHGNSTKDYILGFFVVDPDSVKKWAKNNNLELDSSLMENELLRQTVFDDLM